MTFNNDTFNDYLEKHLARAQALQNQGKIHQALLILNQCTATAKKRGWNVYFSYFRILMLKAILHNQMFEPYQVIHTYEEALKLSYIIPEDEKERWLIEIELGLGRMHYYLLNHHEAARYFENVRSHAKGSIQNIIIYFRASFNLATCLFYIGDFESSLKIFEECITLLDTIKNPTLQVTAITIKAFLTTIHYLMNANENHLRHNKKLILKSISEHLEHHGNEIDFLNNACWSLNLLMNLYMKLEYFEETKEIVDMLKKLLAREPRLLRALDFEFAKYHALIGQFEEGWNYYQQIWEAKIAHLPMEIETEGELTRATLTVLDYTKISDKVERLQKARNIMIKVLEKAITLEQVDFQIKTLVELIKVDLELENMKDIQNYLNQLLKISKEKKLVLIKLIARRLLIRFLSLKNEFETARKILDELKNDIQKLNFTNLLFLEMIKEEEEFLLNAIKLRNYDVQINENESDRPQLTIEDIKEYIKEVEKYILPFS